MEVFEIVTFKELIQRYLEGKLILGDYVAMQDDIFIQVTFSKDSIKVDSPSTEIKFDTEFKIIKYIDKDEILESAVIVFRREDKIKTCTVRQNSINTILSVHSRIKEPVISISVLQGEELVKVWEDGEFL